MSDWYLIGFGEYEIHKLDVRNETKSMLRLADRTPESNHRITIPKSEAFTSYSEAKDVLLKTIELRIRNHGYEIEQLRSVQKRLTEEMES